MLSDSETKIINYIKKEGFISPDFQDVGLSSIEILNTCEHLKEIGKIKRRNCTGLAYELVK